MSIKLERPGRPARNLFRESAERGVGATGATAPGRTASRRAEPGEPPADPDELPTAVRELLPLCRCLGGWCRLSVTGLAGAYGCLSGSVWAEQAGLSNRSLSYPLRPCRSTCTGGSSGTAPLIEARYHGESVETARTGDAPDGATAPRRAGRTGRYGREE